MTKIKVLVEGYASEKNGTASSTATLIQTSNLNIIVDPGIDRPKLLDALENNYLSLDDINYVIATHTHLDHCALAGIFPSAKIIDSDEICTQDGHFQSHDGKIPDTDIKIISTPGHDQFHCSVLVDTKDDKIVVAGDLFWWWDEEAHSTDRDNLINRPDPYVKNTDDLKLSRQKIIELADYIIPGHGKMFKSPKNRKEIK